METLVWEQELDGIRVHQAVLYGHVTRHGELVSLCSQFMPGPAAAADRGVRDRLGVQARPPVGARAAVAAAGGMVGETLVEGGIEAAALAPQGPECRHAFRAAALAGESTARLVWLPQDRETMTLCWLVGLEGKRTGEAFEVLVDAVTGAAVSRRCLTAYGVPQQSRYLVYPSDSPRPGTPWHNSPDGSEPSAVPQVEVVVTAPDGSPNGWIEQPNTRTIGNNVDARLNLYGDDLVWGYALGSSIRPDGNLAGGELQFLFPTDLNSEPTTTANRYAAVVNAFHWANWMHDRLYVLGFTEAAGNFQQDNHGQGGMGSDAMLVDVQDSSEKTQPDRNQNRMLASSVDGSAPRMQLDLFDGPASLNPAEPERDAGLCAEIVLHEYTHALNYRLVGQGAGLAGGGAVIFGLDEGWADFFAMALLSESSDAGNPNVVYPMGGFLARNWAHGGSGVPLGTANYYYGYFPYPYSTATSVNPLTFKDLDPAQGSAHAGVPRSPAYLPALNEGATALARNEQLWGVTLWEMRANLVAAHGFATGGQIALQLVFEGMKLTPPKPNFLEARDAILLADRVLYGGQHLGSLWAAFAKRGMGWSASAPPSTSERGVVEAFDLPPTGNRLWNYAAGTPIYSSPAVAPDGTVYVDRTAAGFTLLIRTALCGGHTRAVAGPSARCTPRRASRRMARSMWGATTTGSTPSSLTGRCVGRICLAERSIRLPP